VSDLKKMPEAADPRNSIFGMAWPYGAQVMALRSLAGEFALRVREDGSWYVTMSYVEVLKQGMLSSPTQKGATPQEAVFDAWTTYSAKNAVVVVSLPGKPRRVLRWDTCMWIDLDSQAGMVAGSEHP
jgi:hypothetical protein